MGGQNQKRLTALLPALLVFCSLCAAQEQKDSLVRLMKAASVQLIEDRGQTFRKAVDATFLHNNTYLICDTALWNVNTKVISAEGNVQLIQSETVLTSERLDYYLDENLAKFRGSLVQLQDKDNNTLRTRVLDYNTRDSVAVFSDGGSLRDKDGQIIESLDGTYDSKAKIFNFRREVNMFTDSIFVKTQEMNYSTADSRADFLTDIDFWKEDNMLSSAGGWYKRQEETFFFEDKVHVLSKEQEGWSDTLYFYRTSQNVLMLGHAQVQDTTKEVFGLAEVIYYEDSLSQVTMRLNAAAAMKTSEQKGTRTVIDTVYFGADTLIYHTVPRCDLSEGLIKDSQDRVAEMFVDPVSEFRAKAAKAAAEAAEAAAKDNPNIPKGPGKAGPGGKGGPGKGGPDDGPGKNGPDGGPGKGGPDGGPGKDAPEDASGHEAPADTLSAPKDSLSAAADSLAIPKDTTKVGFLTGIGNVKLFRRDMQARSDSLYYSDLDSIARFFESPVIWNELTRQYSSDSLFVLITQSGIDRASLMSEAMVITEEKDRAHYSQIKGPEIMAYFDTSAALRRFDALGGVTALFYLEEQGTVATSNKVETKMMSALMAKGTLDKVFYFESPKNDAMPVAQMTKDDSFLKGFNWQPERRPASKADITDLVIRPTERSRYSARPRTTFIQTDRFFPGYMASVYRGIAVRDSLKKLPPKPVADTLQKAGTDTPAAAGAQGDSLSLSRDSVSRDSPAVPRDSLSASLDSLGAAADSLVHAKDSLSAASDTVKVPSAKELREKARAEKLAARRAAREAKWAELDKRDAEKAEAKRQKALARRRRMGLRILEQERRQAAADSAKFERYRIMYEKRKAREDRRAAAKGTGDLIRTDAPAPVKTGPGDLLKADNTPQIDNGTDTK